MPSLKQVHDSNAQLSTHRQTLVAVFIGGTSGIGEATAKELTKAVPKPTIYLVGRSEAAGSRILQELNSFNPAGSYHYIKSDVSLLRNVDKVSDEILAANKPIDLLFMSTGNLAVSRADTVEGLEGNHVLRYYARMRFVTRLMPLLSASESPRVVNVLAGGQEGKIEEDNLDLSKSFSLRVAATYAATMQSLATEQLASMYPSISFVHVFPGLVRTPLMTKSFGGVLGSISTVLTWPFSMSLGESGQRNLFISTSAAYPPARPEKLESVGVPLVDGLQTVAASTGVIGGGSYLLNYDGKDATKKSLMHEYREKKSAEKVWSHTLGIFNKVLGASTASSV